MTDHSTHDLLLLAAAADRGADAELRRAAEEQAARCPACATLTADLRTLTAGLAELPAARPAPRDMRLTPEQAARLRRGRTWRRLLAPFGPDGLPGLRPLATALTTLGLAGILLTAIPAGLGGSAASAPADLGAASEGAWSGAAPPQPEGTAVAKEGPLGPASSPPRDAAGSPAPRSVVNTGASPGATTGGPAAGYDGLTSGDSGAAGGGSTTGGPDGERLRLQATPPPSPLTIVSLGLLVGGLGLFGLLVIGRRAA